MYNNAYFDNDYDMLNEVLSAQSNNRIECPICPFSNKQAAIWLPSVFMLYVAGRLPNAMISITCFSLLTDQNVLKRER